MAVIVGLLLAVFGWAMWKGKLTFQQLPPILLGIGGAFLLTRGSFLLGIGALGIAVVWYRGMNLRLFKLKGKQTDQYATDKARFLLGVSRFDNSARIRERHRALMAQNHPDVGGSEDRARELNEARDLLLHELEKNSR